MQISKKKLFVVQCILIMLIYLGNSKADITAENENTYVAKLEFNEEITTLSGKATFSNTSTIYSFYFEESASVKCSIHILELSKDESLQKRIYKVNIEDKPRTGVVCGVPYDDKSKERITSTDGQVSVEEISNGLITGYFDIELKGDKSGKIFKLSGTFTATPI